MGDARGLKFIHENREDIRIMQNLRFAIQRQINSPENEEINAKDVKRILYKGLSKVDFADLDPQMNYNDYAKQLIDASIGCSNQKSPSRCMKKKAVVISRLFLRPEPVDEVAEPPGETPDEN